MPLNIIYPRYPRLLHIAKAQNQVYMSHIQRQNTLLELEKIKKCFEKKAIPDNLWHSEGTCLFDLGFAS